MRFTSPKRRQPPAVIIISLIDVMIVMLIFLMVTTTFKEHPAIKLKLPESSDAQEGSTENHMVITLKSGSFWIGTVPMKDLKSFRDKLLEAAKKNPKLTLDIRADKDASVQQLYDVIGAAKAAGINPALQLLTETPKQ